MPRPVAVTMLIAIKGDQDGTQERRLRARLIGVTMRRRNAAGDVIVDQRIDRDKGQGQRQGQGGGPP